ncbi:MAG: prepilin-type N-terminal cleavage/methylation domain-containing protein [Patescibacteria group bacterium]
MGNLPPTTYNLKPVPNGFTFVEIIVVVAITALLASIAIIYSQASRQQIMLNVEKAKIAQTILRVKSLTLAGFVKPASNPPPCSYGFYINYGAGTYSIFEYSPVAGCDSILTSSFINTDAPIPPSTLGFKVIEVEKLSPEIKFTTPLPANHLGYIVFIPPDPKVKIFEENKSVFFQPMTIYLSTLDGSLSTTIDLSDQTGQLSL